MDDRNYHIIYPTIDLFLYDLQEGLGQKSDRTFSNRQNFWRKFDPLLDEQIKEQELAEFNLREDKEQSVIATTIADKVSKQINELAAKENSEIDYVKLYEQSFEPHLDGRYTALQLGDTYALMVDCSDVTRDADSSKRRDDKRPIEVLKDIKKIIVSKINHHQNNKEIEDNRQGTIGQTWLVWGKLTGSNKDAKEIAEKCYELLTPNPKWKPNFAEHGEMEGAIVYEYWHAPSNWVQEWEKFSQENYHLVICLFPDNPHSLDEIKKKMAAIYFDLLRLFCYRHKVLWAYRKSRHLKKKLKESATQINELIGKIKEVEAKQITPNELQSTLIKSLPAVSDYAVHLNRLDTHHRTIKINLENYRKRLEKIEKNENTNLGILSEFYTTADERYRQQIEMDSANLSSGLTLLENLISTIGSTIDIEQTKSDRALNEKIALVGVGLAVSGITSTVVTEQQPPPKNTFFMFTPAFVWSIGMGLIATAIALIFLRIFRRK